MQVAGEAGLLLRFCCEDAEDEGEMDLWRGTAAGTLEGSKGAKDRPLQEPQRRARWKETKGVCGVMTLRVLRR